MNTKNSKRLITVSGNLPRPGQKNPAVIVLTQPKRFGIDIADYMAAVRAAENVDFPRRYKLYDLYSDILLDTHLSSVIEKRRNAVLCADIRFTRDGKPDDTINEQIKSPWFNRLVADIIDSRFWGFVPEDHIVGKASFVWLSLDANKSFPSNIRWERLFKKVR